MQEINNIEFGSVKGKRIVSSFYGTTYIFNERPGLSVFDKLVEMHNTNKEIVNVLYGSELPTTDLHVYKGIKIETYLSTPIDI